MSDKRTHNQNRSRLLSEAPQPETPTTQDDEGNFIAGDLFDMPAILEAMTADEPKVSITAAPHFATKEQHDEHSHLSRRSSGLFSNDFSDSRTVSADLPQNTIKGMHAMNPNQEDTSAMQLRAEHAASLAPNELIGKKMLGLSNPVHMDIIDKLRDLGVHEFVDLPQLVVVGDQSSGKSSVLESIMDIPLPRDASLCTRFATNIIFRRQKMRKVAISIIPGKTSNAEKEKRLRAWRYDTETLDGKFFLEALQEASRAMGVRLRANSYEEGGKTFSDDIFKVEIYGPSEINLSVIDIPGLFRAKTDGITTDEDMLFVEDMVRGYIQNKRTIILAVMASNTDIATQAILRMVEKADPHGQRTLGVLTKPDLIDKGTEDTIIDLVRGKKHKLKLGYCVVRNRSKREQGYHSSEMMKIEEAFFNSPPFNQLPRARVGINSLLILLQSLHGDVIDREFPAIKSQIQMRVTDSKRELLLMGEERTTPEEQRRFLDIIAIKFQDICRDAMDCAYHRHDITRIGTGIRLPTAVADRKEQFGSEVLWKGHSIDFNKEDVAYLDKTVIESDDNPNSAPESEPVASIVDDDDAPEGEFKVIFPIEQAKNRQEDSVRYPELDAILSFDDSPPALQEQDIKVWIERVYREHRGYSLELIGPHILPMLWQEQSEKWEGIARRLINDIIVLVHRFICGVLQHVCPDEHTKNNLLGLIRDELLVRYRRAIEQVEFIVAVERKGTLLTENHYFGVTLSKVRAKRQDAQLNKLSRKVKIYDAEAGTYTETSVIRTSRLSELHNSDATKSNTQFAVEDLHNILYVYCKTAKKRFIDTVLMQAMDHFLLRGPPSPLHLLTSLYISKLKKEELEKVAGEDMVSRNKRRELRKEIAALEEAREVMRGF